MKEKGADKLKKYLETEDLILKQNIEGILYMFNPPVDTEKTRFVSERM